MIALYKGRSFTSKVIRCFNWSAYSHAAWLDTMSNCVIEAWKGRVRRVADLHQLHTPGTVVDIYRVDITSRQDSIIAAFLAAQVGKRYDYRGIVHFLTRRPERAADQDRWFCSELVFAAYAAAGVNLLARVPAYKVYPGLLSYSPILTHVSTIRTRRPEKASNRPVAGGVPEPALRRAQIGNHRIAARAEGFAETPAAQPATERTAAL